MEGPLSALWVFGYGSLMWNPGFQTVEIQPASLMGWHRSLCVYSHVHRGTPERPGLVLGLDRGGSCRGLALRVAEGEEDIVLDYLRKRELVTAAYREIRRPIRLNDSSNRIVNSVSYVVDRAHHQYAGQLSIDQVLQLVRHGQGQSGLNRDYVINTAIHLMSIGIQDQSMNLIYNALNEDRATA